MEHCEDVLTRLVATNGRIISLLENYALRLAHLEKLNEPRSTSNSSSEICSLSEHFEKFPFPQYDGSTSWTMFKEQFEAAAQLNEFPMWEWIKLLILALKGPALNTLLELPNFERRQYDHVMSTLERKYGMADIESKMSRLQLRRCQQQPGQAIRDFGDHVQKLARKAFPTAESTLQEYMAVRAFIDGLLNEETQKALLMEGPNSLFSAIVFAEDIDK